MSAQNDEADKDNSMGHKGNPRSEGTVQEKIHRPLRRKNGLIYNILSNKKKKQRNRKQRKTVKEKRQTTIMKYYSEAEEVVAPLVEEQAPQIERCNHANSGDIESRYGNKINKDIDDKVFRVFSNNINGITNASQGDEFLEELTVMKEFNVAVATLSETNTNWNIPGVYDETKKKINKVWKKNKLVTSNCYERTKTKYQPGGTATLITSKSTHRVCDSGADELGRWSFATMKGKNGRKVTMVTAYRVCENTLATAGPATCWMQQWRALRKKGVEVPNPREQFMRDFEQFLEDRLNQGEELIVGMDINEENNGTADIRQLCNRLDLIDVHHHLHGEREAPSTYQRGNHQLDFLFITPGILPALLTAGFLPFHVPFLSDHCTIYADFDTDILFNGLLPNPLNNATRGVASENPKRKDKYVTLLGEYFTDHNIKARVQQLYDDLINRKIPLLEGIDRYESLDREITHLMLSAEKKCSRGCQGYAWSIKLVTAARIVRYWKLRKSNFMNNRDDCKRVLDLGNILHIPYATCDISALQKHLLTARKDLRKAQQNAACLRDDFLEEMAQLYITSSNTNIAAIIKNIKHREEVKQAFASLRYTAKGHQPGSVSTIKIPEKVRNNNGMYDAVLGSLQFAQPWQEIDDSDDIMKRLLQRNKLHLNQACETPFASGPLRDYIGDYGIGQGGKAIINGEFDPNEECNLPAVNYWLKHHIRRVVPAGSTRVELTVQEFKDLVKSQTESTSSSPSGRHYGHYKAILCDDGICLVHAQMMSMPFLFGFTPARWQKALDVMLEKDIGDPKIHRLRIIVIVEGDMNMIMKTIWNKRLVPVAEKFEFLSPVQFGNRKGRTSLDALLLKIVTMDSLRLFRLNGAVLNNDAKACYDRMIPEVTALHLQSLGLPDNATKCSIQINQKMKHFIKTSEGISSDHYQHTDSYAKYGEGQGKASSPPNWLFQSSTILNALHCLVGGIFLYSVCKKFISKRVAEAYVDDTDCTYCDQDKRTSSPSRLRDKLQQIAQTWEKLIFGTGGELSLDKTYWWLIKWIWVDGTAHMATKDECPIDMKITIGNSNTPKKVKRKEVSASVRQLGVLANPAGDFSEELESRQRFSTSMATRIRSSRITPKNAFRLYRNIWLPACQYPLAVTSFSKKECLSIMQPFVRAILPKLGFNRNSPREIIFGLQKYGGFQFLHLYLEQGFLALKHLIGHIREATLVGNQIRIALDQAQVISGSGSPFLEEVSENRSYVPPSWLGNVRSFLSVSNSKVVVHDVWVPEIQRINDSILMDSFGKSKPGDATLEKLNAVRLFLGVITLADITNDLGTQIEPWALSGSKRARPTISWPNQGRPSDSCWVVWRRFLKKHFSSKTKKAHRLNKPLMLDKPLGHWLTDAPYATREFYFDPTTSCIIHYNGTNFIKFRRCNGRTSLYSARGSIPSLPQDAVRTTATKLGPFLSSTAASDYFADRPEVVTPDSPTFQTYMRTLPSHTQRLLGNLLQQDIDVKYWMSELKAGNVKVATDGSVAKRQGFFAVVFYTETQLLRFQGPCDGAPSLISSFRAELAGILATLYFLNALTDFSNETFSLQLPLYCDNASAVLTAASDKTAPGIKAHLCADYDLIAEIRSEKSKGIPLLPSWVKAHQDEKKPLKDLDLDAQLNCMADKDAEHFRKTAVYPLAPISVPPEFPTTPAFVIVNDEVCTKDLKQQLMHAYEPVDLRKFIRKKTSLSDEALDFVDWDNLGANLGKQTLHNQVRLVKFMHNWLHVGRRKTLMNETDSGVCPVCETEQENWLHLFQCPHDDAVAIRALALTSFNTAMLKAKTSPAIRQVLKFKLAQWMHLDHGSPPRVHDDHLGNIISAALHEQHDLGWDNFMKGRLSKKWGDAQEYFYDKFFPASGYTRDFWVQKIITASWQIFFLLWKARNAHLHSSLNDGDSTHLNLRIKRAFGKLRHSMAKSDSLLFHMPLEDRLQTSHYAKLAWLESVRIAEHDFSVVHKRLPTQRTIPEFFTPTDCRAAMDTLEDDIASHLSWHDDEHSMNSDLI